MSLIGSVSITNPQDGLYLGSVNVDNADEFALTSNSLYVNDGINTIQSKIDESTQADVIYISSGSYGEQLQILNKYNMALQAPSTASTICEVLNGVIIDGTSELIRLSNLQIKGANSQIFGVGRQRFENIVFTGTAVQTNTVEFGKYSTKYMTIMNCEFDNYCNILVSNLFTSVIYFINCNFGGATITLSQASPLQVIFNNCANFVSFPVNATYVGMNVLSSGVMNLTTTNINGSAYPPASSGLSCTAQADHRIVTATATTDVLHANQILTWDDLQLSLFNSSPLTIGRGNNLSSAVSNLAIGYQSLNSIGTGSNNVGIGYLALNQCINNSNNVHIGANITSSSGANESVAIGSLSTCTGNQSVVIGQNAKAITAGVVVGQNSGRIGGSSNNILGKNSFNNATTSASSYNNIIGYNIMTANAGNTAFYNNIMGTSSVTNLTAGANNNVIGTSSGTLITTHSNNTIIGHSSFSTGTGYSNCASLGANINVISGDNQVQLGDSATNTYIYGVLQVRSDSRDKNYIGDLEYGLDFIENLRPVKYKYNYREDYQEIIKEEDGTIKEIINHIKDGTKTRNRWHWGLIAQEVERVMNRMSFDAGLLQNHKINGGEDRYTLGYEELIAPLIKAVQQLSEQNKRLELRIQILENKI